MVADAIAGNNGSHVTPQAPGADGSSPDSVSSELEIQGNGRETGAHSASPRQTGWSWLTGPSPCAPSASAPLDPAAGRTANDSGEADPMPLYSYVIGELNKFGLAYLHLIEPRASGAGQREVDHKDAPSGAGLVRPLWKGPLITAGNFKADTAEAMLASGNADVIAFGRYFIANPDLPERIRKGAAWTPYNRATFYGGTEVGYTDYPAMEPEKVG